MWQISIKDVENIRIGQAENLSAGTGCTVVICDRGAPTGIFAEVDPQRERQACFLLSQAPTKYTRSC